MINLKCLPGRWPLFVGILFFLGGMISVSGKEPPNIVVIIVDDLGYGDLSSYGATDLKTPHIDSLITEGMRFDNFYANCPVCSPTRAALLTGRYQELVGVPGVIRTHPENSWGYLSAEAVMLPEILAGAGYHSAAIGKWHLGLDDASHPVSRGFDFFHGFLGDMMDDYYHHRRHDNEYMYRNREAVDPEGHATDIFSDWAVSYIEGRSKSAGPFFLYLAYNAPHTPIQPPEDWLKKVLEREPGINEARAKLVALIEHMDAGIGRVVEGLISSGEWDNTLLFFVSDNGGQLNVGANCGNWRGGKQDMYEGGIRVPAGVVWPGKIEAGSRTDFVAATMDIFPTAAAAAGVKVDFGIDGESFLPTLLGEAQAPFERDLFFCRREGNERYMGEMSWAMRRGNWKLVKNSPMTPWELYDLEADPLESTDLAKKNVAKFRELAAGMRRHIQRGGAVPWQKAED
ncbi:MAG: sulfatase-like hydrolase/transferase [Verrucomicrobiota bacterium]